MAAAALEILILIPALPVLSAAEEPNKTPQCFVRITPSRLAQASGALGTTGSLAQPEPPACASRI